MKFEAGVKCLNLYYRKESLTSYVKQGLNRERLNWQQESELGEMTQTRAREWMQEAF